MNARAFAEALGIDAPTANDNAAPSPYLSPAMGTWAAEQRCYLSHAALPKTCQYELFPERGFGILSLRIGSLLHDPFAQRPLVEPTRREVLPLIPYRAEEFRIVRVAVHYDPITDKTDYVIEPRRTRAKKRNRA